MSDREKAAFLEQCPVSRETLRKLDTLVDELTRWTVHINLVSRTTLGHVWRRHILDSAQLMNLAPPHAKAWVDLGSGAGFPGLVISAMARDLRPELSMTLIESDARKCAFLAAASRAMDIAVTIENRRIEQSPDRLYDVISARALAPLPALMALSEPYMASDAVGLFPKGEGVDRELTEALRTRHIHAERTPSKTDPSGVILTIKGVSRARSGE